MTATLDDVMAELRVVRQLLERQARPQLLPKQRAVVMRWPRCSAYPASAPATR